MTITELTECTEELALGGGIESPSAYARDFVNKLNNHPEIYREYVNYLYTGKLACAYSIKGYTIADIIIYQMDHFKSLLDNHIAQNKGNQYRMVLGGFETMMKMEDNPDDFIAVMQETTGTDYLGKY